MIKKVVNLMKKAEVSSTEVLSMLLQVMAIEVGEKHIAEELNRLLGLDVEEQDVIFLISYVCNNLDK